MSKPKFKYTSEVAEETSPLFSDFERVRRLHEGIVAALGELEQMSPRGPSKLRARVDIDGRVAVVTVWGEMP